jgi:NAD-dependent SIR2 family protein deacetylase
MHEIKQAIEEATNVVFFTGAGISTDSGIPDYRGAKGIGQDIPFEEVLSLRSYKKDPVQFWNTAFNTMQWGDLAKKEPSSGHQWIQSLESETRKVTVLTQNIDGLHNKAGSTNIINLHGTIQEGLCVNGHFNYLDLSNSETPFCEQCQTIIKPNVILYGEEVRTFIRALDVVIKADVFIAMGSTLKVAPVNSLIENAKYIAGAKVFIINNEDTEYMSVANRFYKTSISDFVTAYEK